MKNLLKKYIWKGTLVCGLILLLGMNQSCSDFEEINENPRQLSTDEVSAKYFVTKMQIELYAPNRYPYWRAQLIHADRFAGFFTFGFNGCWWTGGTCYTYHSGYTDAAYDWMSNYLGTVSGFLNFVKPEGDLQNEKYEAIGLIMKGLYYQMYTDTFGMLPFTEAFDVENLTPKYDTQDLIYKGVIDDLNYAMELIGDATSTGDGVEFLSSNDLFFDGDLQKWKKLANTLKLRMALRAYGAPNADFALPALNEAMSAPTLSMEDENALVPKDTEISQWANAAYGDVWYNFGVGSNWKVSKTVIDLLQENNDPRLTKYAKPIEGGKVTLTQYAEGDRRPMFDKHKAFILQQLDDAHVVYNTFPGQKTNKDGISIDTLLIDVSPGTYYVGEPSRLSGFIYPYVKYELFSDPADIIINAKNQGNPIAPEIAMTAAEGNFLKAQAITMGLASGDAQAYYQEGIKQAMLLWGVNDDEISMFMANEDMALLNGSMEDNLEKIVSQRWLADYTDGFEGWALVRDTGYPEVLANGVPDDTDLYSQGTILNGRYPARMRYGNKAYSTNNDNTVTANGVQGADDQSSKLWWAK